MDDTSEKLTSIPWMESIVDTIRVRPAFYLGANSLTAFWHFFQGYEMGRWRSTGEYHSEISGRFADWVGYRLHLHSNWDGLWHLAILSKVRDEAVALSRFFELWDEFARREAKVVATIREDCREYSAGRQGADGQIVRGTELLPKSLRIIVYTEDPGFFLEAGEDEKFFENGWFYPALDFNLVCPIAHRFNVQDEKTWNRLLDENKRYRRNLHRARARLKRKENGASSI